MNINWIQCYGDSDLVSQQESGKWDSKNPIMAAYRREVQRQAGFFVGYQVDNVDHRENEAADALSRLGSQRKPVPPNVFLDVLTKPSVQPRTEQDIAKPDPELALVAAIHATPSWVVPYLDYKTRGILPQDEMLARQIVRRSQSFVLINGELHRRSAADVFQRCVSPEEGRAILNEIHSGDCGHHAGSRSLVAKAFRHGFYWLTSHADAEDIVKKCDGCQRYAKQAHVPAQELRMIPITWPFAVWGLDMVGPFKRSANKNTHILVGVDKCTKWVEAEPVSKCDAATSLKFLKKIIYRFGYPHSIITDNGSNLSEGVMQ